MKSRNEGKTHEKLTRERKTIEEDLSMVFWPLYDLKACLILWWAVELVNR